VLCRLAQASLELLGMTSGKAEVVSWSKDSIFVRWKFDDDDDDVDHLPAPSNGSGYMVRYQAVGSSVIQISRLLDITASAYDITHLHENTNYDICVLRVRQPLPTGGVGGEASTVSAAAWPTDARACIKATTSTDSLSVALGSTFGAFLALGLIVALVFVAKWQHSRRAKKHQQQRDAAAAEVAAAKAAAAEVAGNGSAGKTGAGTQLNDDEDDDVLRVEIAELDTSEFLRLDRIFSK